MALAWWAPRIMAPPGDRLPRTPAAVSESTTSMARAPAQRSTASRTAPALGAAWPLPLCDADDADDDADDAAAVGPFRYRSTRDSDSCVAGVASSDSKSSYVVASRSRI